MHEFPDSTISQLKGYNGNINRNLGDVVDEVDLLVLQRSQGRVWGRSSDLRITKLNALRKSQIVEEHGFYPLEVEKSRNPRMAHIPHFFLTYMAYSTISLLGKSSTLSLSFLSFEKGLAIYFRCLIRKSTLLCQASFVASLSYLSPVSLPKP